MPELALGTAQFGLDYGITNQSGQVPEQEVSLILEEAAAAGIRYLDTAQAYGNAETILGKTLSKKHSFKIVSKLPKQNSEPFNAESQKKWERDFQFSLQKMGVNAIEGFLLHNPVDIKRDDAYYLFEWLLTLKERGLVNHLGLSIYEASDLDGISLDWVQLVQLPLSLYDQRLFHDGTIKFLKAQKILIHVRSVLLQGLIATPSIQWPVWLHNTSFFEHHKKVETIANKLNKELLQLAIDFCFYQSESELDCVLIGVNSLNNFRQILGVIKSHDYTINYEDFLGLAFHDEKYIDPRNWYRR